MQGKPSEITGELHFQAPRSISKLPEYGKHPGFILQHNCIIALCPLKFQKMKNGELTLYLFFDQCRGSPSSFFYRTYLKVMPN